jgi:hypothetical protein
MRSEREVDRDRFLFFCNAFMCHHVSALMLFTIFPLEFIVGLATSVGHPNQVYSTGQEFGRIYFHLFFFLPCREILTYTSSSSKNVCYLGSAFLHVSFLCFPLSTLFPTGKLGGLLLKDERKMGRLL